MFSDAFMFSTISVDDLDKADQLYRDVLGLATKRNAMGLLEVDAGHNTGFIAYPKPDHQPAAFTVQNIGVDDIDAAIEYLTSKGVKFKIYQDGMSKTDDRGVSASPDGTMKIAWFKDPAGNIFSIIEGGHRG
jgi:catechol 2,3-dioxygenase-like lactoylglutathione lyase family enzyme